MKQKSFVRRALLLAVLGAVLLSSALPAFAFPFGGAEEAPAVTAFSKNGPEGQMISFAAEDFKVEGEETLEALGDRGAARSGPPGTLYAGGSPLAVGDVVSMSAVDGLRFDPLPVVTDTSFVFTPVFQSGAAASQVEVGLHLLATENAAPVAEDLELSTYKNVAITSALPPPTGGGSADLPAGGQARPRFCYHARGRLRPVCLYPL